MLIFDAIGLASWRYFIHFVVQGYPEMKESLDEGKGHYTLLFLADLLTMALYTTILTQIYRRNRSTGFPSTADVPTSSSPVSSAWSVFRILFTVFLSGFILYSPIREIDSVRISNFNVDMYCGPRPTLADVQLVAMDLMWIYNGCVVRYVRSIVAIVVGFLVLIELALSLKVAHTKNKNASSLTLASEDEKY